MASRIIALVTSAGVLLAATPAAAATPEAIKAHPRDTDAHIERDRSTVRVPPAMTHLRRFWGPLFARPEPDRPAPGSAKAARIRLGHALFFDPRLSRTKDMSCATCHQPALGFADGQPRRIGRIGRPLTFTVPSLFNVGAAKALTWTGTVSSLEAYIDRPIHAANEMAANWPDILASLEADAAIAALIDAGFPDASQRPKLTADRLKTALADYQRTITAPQTRFDAWISGQSDALTAREVDGFAVFVGRAGCVSCHGGWRFTDDKRHDIGLPGPTGLLKTPGLRGLSLTAPYMHDGRFQTLAAVVAHYETARRERPRLLPGPRSRSPLNNDEIDALTAFLAVL